MPIHEIKFRQGKCCDYCDKPRAQKVLDENGICPECREVIDRLRAEFEIPGET